MLKVNNVGLEFKKVFGIAGLAMALTGASAFAQLPTGVSALPIYDTTKAGLSFRKDRLPIVGMYEVPGNPKNFVVVGYFGYIWTLYQNNTLPDTMAAWGPIRRYTRTQVADFNTWVMKGWEFGALGGGFDPNFSANHYFYVIYNKYPFATQYRAGTPGTNTANDGPGNPNAIVVIDRYIMSPNLATMARDTEMVRILHGTGYGSSNMIFGSDGMCYITTDAYDASSWDSTILARKILRVDLSTPQGGRMYTIPTTNPWYNVTNPAVRKEVYAFGFRNTYSLSYNYLTNQLYGAETGQSRWEEINHIFPGKNYGWNNGGDGAAFGSNSWGIEGPCHVGAALDSSTAAGGFTLGAYLAPYTRTITGTNYNGTYTCANFQNPAWWTGHGTGLTDGLANSATNSQANVGNISPAVRGNPASPFYGYMFISDIDGAGNHFRAVKTDRVAPVDVGQFPPAYIFTGDHTHNGVTTWSEDSYGNLYPILLSSSSSGAFQWHDIFMLYHAQLSPLTTPRTQVVPILSQWTERNRLGKILSASAMAGGSLVIPAGYSGIEIYNLMGRKLWSVQAKELTGVNIPNDLEKGILRVRYLTH